MPLTFAIFYVKSLIRILTSPLTLTGKLSKTVIHISLSTSFLLIWYFCSYHT